MARGIFKLDNPVKHYDWGSPDCIPALLCLDNADKKPYAELWMGGVSKADGQPLAALIQSAPDFFLGAEAASRYQGALPYLFKLLAAAKPLSIQAHPNLKQARAGFARENAQGIPLDDPKRTYKDANHKPEIICALSEYEALCGFRPIDEIERILRLFACPALDTLAGLFAEDLPEEALLRTFTEKLFAIPDAQKEALAAYIAGNTGRLVHDYPEYASLWELAARLLAYYPGDRAIIAPFYLNYIRLSPGEAIYLPSGILHGYLHGFGVELMANSDNVIRGGLTPKYVDTAELRHVIDFHPYKPALLAPDSAAWYTYKNPPSGVAMADEFKLSVMRGAGDSMSFPASITGPVIFAVVEGACTIQGDEGELALRGGESAFIAAGIARAEFTLNGTWTAYLAGV